MALCNKGETVKPARYNSASSLLLAFIVISILVHGLSLLWSQDPVTQTAARPLGTRYTSTVITATTPPKALPTPHVPATEQTGYIAKSVSLAEVATAKKTTPKTSHKATLSPQTQEEIPPAQQATNSTATAALAKPASPSRQRLQQRNYLLGEIQNSLSRYLTYPQRARRRGWQGEVIVSLRIDNLGQLNHVRLAKSSGYSLLDRSAVAAIAKLDAIDLPNRFGPSQAMELLLPVSYQLRDG